ncbi:MAG: membrane protein insertase YidC [Myxococcaceae bacterium]|jgi:YidC/Oxa1 family membrane protein insertase|nr:membrane protein insertase YidC [Myxococcaceae bacterium]MCA3012631.1 membrane protein insertase YidC [Myxococcaceae bacterium]
MDTQKRLYLAVALMLGLTMVFQIFIWGPEAEKERARLAALDGGVAVVADASVDEDGGVAVAVAPAPDPVALEDGGVAQAAPSAPVEVPLRTLERVRSSMKMTFTSQGAGLVDAVLTGVRERDTQRLSVAEGYQRLVGKQFPPGEQMDLANPVPGQAPQLGVSIVGGAPLAGTLRYEVTEEAPGRLVFTGAEGPWRVVKTFTWDPEAKGLTPDVKRTERDPRGYQVHLAVAVTNTSAVAQRGELVVQAVRAVNPADEEAPSLFGSIGNQASVLCRSGEDVRRHMPGEKEGTFLSCGGSEKTDFEEKGAIGFVAIDQQYFLTALWPSGGAVDGRCLLHAAKAERRVQIAVPLELGPQATASKEYDAYLGPKDLEMLQNVGTLSTAGGGAPAAAVGLDGTVDFGVWAVICKGLLFFLRFFHGLLGNWGFAIILLTVMVKVVLLPLTHKAMVSAEQMKKLQPEMEKIKQKYPDDREKQQLEQMRLYQEAKVNPLGGCLPLLVQFPIWGALFTTLRTSYELYGEPFVGVWADLTYKDPTYLLPLALGVTMIVTQRLQPQMMTDPGQAFLITWVMPIFFTAVMMNYPAGLALYIFTNNLLSIAQQFALRKYLERTGQAAPKPATAPKPPEGK